MDGARVRGVLGVRDVLAEVEADDGVVGPVGVGEVRAAERAARHDVDPVGHPGARRPVAQEGRLRRRRRERGDARAVLVRRVPGERAAPAPEVEEPRVGPDAERAADPVEHRGLRLLQRADRCGGRPARGGRRDVRCPPPGLVGEVPRVEHRRGRLGRPALAVLRAAVAGRAVAPRRGQPDTPHRRGLRAARGRQQRPRERLGQRLPRGCRLLAGRPAQPGQDVAEIAVDGEVAGDVGMRDAELARMPQQAAESAGRADHECRCVGRTVAAAVPRHDAHGHLAAEERLADLAQGRGDVGDAAERPFHPCAPLERSGWDRAW